MLAGGLLQRALAEPDAACACVPVAWLGRRDLWDASRQPANPNPCYPPCGATQIKGDDAMDKVWGDIQAAIESAQAKKASVAA